MSKNHFKLYLIIISAFFVFNSFFLHKIEAQYQCECVTRHTNCFALRGYAIGGSNIWSCIIFTTGNNCCDPSKCGGASPCCYNCLGTLEQPDQYGNCEGSNSWCNENGCPATTSYNDQTCELIVPCAAGLETHCTGMYGIWDASEEQCVTCNEARQSKKIADTTQECYSRSGGCSSWQEGSCASIPTTCESACGASPSCDERTSSTSLSDKCDGFTGNYYTTRIYNRLCDSNCAYSQSSEDCTRLNGWSDTDCNGNRAGLTCNGNCERTKIQYYRSYSCSMNANGNSYCACAVTKTQTVHNDYCLNSACTGSPATCDPTANCNSNQILCSSNLCQNIRNPVKCDGNNTCNKQFPQTTINSPAGKFCDASTALKNFNPGPCGTKTKTFSSSCDSTNHLIDYGVLYLPPKNNCKYPFSFSTNCNQYCDGSGNCVDSSTPCVTPTTHCCKGVCNAKCAVASDCSPGQTCNLNTCTCSGSSTPSTTTTTTRTTTIRPTTTIKISGGGGGGGGSRIMRMDITTITTITVVIAAIVLVAIFGAFQFFAKKR